MTTPFQNWLQTFSEEKQIDRDQIFEIELNGNTHMVEVGHVLDQIHSAPDHEQAAIKDILVKIDFHNGDVYHFLGHLAKALAANYERNMQ